jgi:uncharacterized membrane protein
MRALSPGVNDSFTAVACVDQLSAALAIPISRAEVASEVRLVDGKPRLRPCHVTIKALVGSGLHPLRRAAAGNVMVTLRLVEAVDRLARVSDPSHANMVSDHLDLIAVDADRTVANEADRREIESVVSAARATLASRFGTRDCG